MTNFEYQPRSRYDLEGRIGQDGEGGKVPKSDSETPCVTCGHIKEFHCKKFRKGEKPRGYLWVWNYAQPRLQCPVKCKHTPADATLLLEPPKCGSSACAVSDCSCPAFLSPYRKPRVKKATTAKPRKRAAKPRAEQLELLPSPNI